MPAPTFAGEAETVWNTVTTPKASASVTVAVGDVLVVFAAMEDFGTTPINTPTGGAQTFTLRESIITPNYCPTYIWTAVMTTAQTFAVTVTSNGSKRWGFNVLKFTGSAGIGATASINSTNAPSLNLTTTGANSAIVAVSSDWNAVDGATRVWRTINSITPTAANALEVTYAFNSLQYTAYGAYWSDAGAAGLKVVGQTAPATQQYCIAAVEVLGAASGIPFGTAAVKLNLDVNGTGKKVPKGTDAIKVNLDVNGTGKTVPKGSAAIKVNLDVNGTGKAVPKGTDAVKVNLKINATGKAPRRGTASLNLGIDPAASGKTVPKGQDAIKVNVDVNGSGKTTPKGSDAIKVNLDVNANGHAPAVAGAAVGTAAIKLNLDVNATGRKPTKGSAPIKLNLDVNGSGIAPAVVMPKGSAGVRVNLDVNGSGKTVPKGTDAIKLAIAGVGTGRDPSAKSPVASHLLLETDHQVGLSSGYHVRLETDHEVSLTWIN